MAACKFCLEIFTKDEKPTTLTQKGCMGLIRAGALFPNDETPSPGDKIHEKCRKKRLKECSKEVANEIDLTESQFMFSESCLFCGKQIKYPTTQTHRNIVYHVKASNFRETMCHIIAERNDEWATEVCQRIESHPDLVAANAIYHQQCNVNFRTSRNKPNAQSSVRKGAPVNEHLNESFLKLVAFLEASNEPYSTSDLSEKFEEFSGGETYTVRYLKDRLIKHFGDRIIFVSRNGLSDLVVMRETSEHIIIESYEAKSHDANSIMKNAATVVLKDIKSIKNNKDTYPSPDEISSIESGLSFIPISLQVFLRTIFGELKTDQTTRIISIGHAIIQVCRPRCLLSSIQIGLGIQVSVLTASRFLVDTLHSLGFCCSYAEVRKFKYCATIANNQIENGQANSSTKVTKYVADNVDHNLCTLDGKGTFHGMGMIAIESETENRGTKKIVRTNVTMEDIKVVNGVEIIHYSEDVEVNIGIKYNKLSPTTIYDAFNKLDLLWTLSWPSVPDRPAWSGFMQLVTSGSYSEKPTISFLPMIDLSSSSLTCLYSTMLFISKEATKNGSTPILTFDQPLYWKARLIKEMEPESSQIKRIVLMLGGFHMKMSYLGCIGYLMTGSGLEEVLQQIYAPNSVIKMLSGKAIARAIRGHLLIYAALNAIISEELFSESEKAVIASLFQNILGKKVIAEELQNNMELIKMESKLTESKNKLKLQGGTSELWLQYMKMIDIFKANVRADRIADFQLHLQTIQTMLPFYPAAGHNSYTKSIRVYIQDMEALKVSSPEVYKFLDDGNFVTRRTNRYWGGLPDDLIIEQVLMRSLKSAGGLTRGTGFGESQRTIWLKSMPSCGAINEAMQNFCHKALETSEQHKELGLTRKKRDISDTKILYDYLKEKNVFGNIPGLRNIVDGLVSSSNCNPNDAESKGMSILKKMDGSDSSEFVFKKTDQIVVMNSKNTVQIDDENVQIDPEVLFQRLLFIQNNRNKNDLESILQYELTQRPPVFFDDRGFLRDGNESALVDTLWKKFGSKMISECETLDECDYVLSGDWVINEVCWQIADTFDEICTRYVEFVIRRYGKSATVIFSENETVPSIVDEKNIRDMKGVCGSEISFTGSTSLKMKKQNFLNNAKNRNGFVMMLSGKLKDAGCNVFGTVGDANLLIAQTATLMSQKKMVIVIGEESNLLTLMCFYAQKTNFELYLRCTKKVKSSLNMRLWNIAKMQNLLGTNRSKHLLFVHAFGGCQSTSHIFGISEGTLYSKLDIKHFSAQADIFCNRFATKDEIIEAGQQAMIILFKGKAGQKLNTLRFEKYKEKVTTETANVLAKRLPPTESATAYHSLRSYYQIQTWMQQNKGLNPLDYGWKEANKRYVPVFTSLPPAPSELLSAIRCGCKGGCNTLRCKCKGAGLRCTTACKNCDHEKCKNYDNSYDEDDDDQYDIMEYLGLDY